MKRIFYVFLCCFIIIFLIFIVYSKYKNSINLETSTNIAEPFFEVVTVDTNKIEFLNNDKYEHEFVIKNYNENTVSEVAFDYNIKFNLSQEDAPIVLELYRIDGEEKTKIELSNNKTIISESFGLEKEEMRYVVEVIYDKSSNNILESNLNIDLNVECIQKEEFV